MNQISKIVPNELSLIEEKLCDINFFNQDISNDIRKFLMSPTKRIRSLINILYLKSKNIEISSNVIKILLVGEFVHNASLLHDDVIDEAKERRGITTIGEKYSSKISILAGNLLLAKAISVLQQLKNRTVEQIFLGCILQMNNAEIMQGVKRGFVPTKEEYLYICRGKTASLFNAISKSISVTLDLNDANFLDFAENFGLYFQIKNDLEEKSALEDKKNGVYTFDKVFGLENGLIFIDNCFKALEKNINLLPQNVYREGLESILREL